MSNVDSKKVRVSIILFGATLAIGALGLAGCPSQDDDDFFGKATPGIVQDGAESAK